MRQAVRSEPAPAPSVPPTPVTPAPTPARTAVGFYAATRVGKKKITAAVDPAVHKQLKSLAVERDTTTEALLTEAIADLFAKHGGPAGGG